MEAEIAEQLTWLGLVGDVLGIILAVTALLITVIGFFASLHFYTDGTKLQNKANEIMSKISEKADSIHRDMSGVLDKTLDAAISRNREPSERKVDEVRDVEEPDNPEACKPEPNSNGNQEKATDEQIECIIANRVLDLSPIRALESLLIPLLSARTGKSYDLSEIYSEETETLGSADYTKAIISSAIVVDLVDVEKDTGNRKKTARISEELANKLEDKISFRLKNAAKELGYVGNPEQADKLKSWLKMHHYIYKYFGVDPLIVEIDEQQ
jgi:hypothetical protein